MSSQGRYEAVSLDGTAYEGGGGLIRYGIALSSILNRPLRIHSIRANRPGVGGLRPEHTVAIDSMAQLTAAQVSGNKPASREITFNPHADLSGNHAQPPTELDVTVEGSASIFLVAMLPFILFSHLGSRASHFTSGVDESAGLELTIRAGTLCVKAPSINYLRQVFVPTMKLVGIGEDYLGIDNEHEQGWHTENTKFPGKMVARIKPLKEALPGFILERRGELQTIRATAHVPGHVLDQFKENLVNELKSAVGGSGSNVEVIIDVFKSVPDDQYHLLLVATTVAPTAYLGYEQVYPQSDVFPKEMEGDEEMIASRLIRCCIRGLWAELRTGNAVDEHMEDMLVIYQSLASGFSSVSAKNGDEPVPEFNAETPSIKSGSLYEISTGSMHRATSWWMVEQLTGVKTENRLVNGREHVGCRGIGLGS